MRFAVAFFLCCLLIAVPAAAAPPSFADLAKIPVIRFGEPAPQGDFILQFPAGKPITISVAVEGSLFTNGATAVLEVAPKQEFYVFGEWASLDGVKWIPRSELIKSDVLLKIPGYNHPLPGIVKIRMDLVETR